MKIVLDLGISPVPTHPLISLLLTIVDIRR